MLMILAFIVVLGITITVHEFGHFAMAKLLKIRVLVFSLGFGPKLFGFTRGGTEYRLSPIPLGGYVKMAGENYGDDRQGAPDEFLSHPKRHRFLVALAGPFMNILLAVVIVALAYMQGTDVPRYPQEPPLVGPVASDSIAKRAGLRTGDRIVAVNNSAVKTWEELEIALGTAPRGALNMDVLRGEQPLRLHFDFPPGWQEDMDPAALGFKFPLPRTIVAAVEENSPARKAGLKPGDEILSVEHQDRVGRDYNQILNIISESEGIPLEFAVRRPAAGAPKKDAVKNPMDPESEILRLRIAPVRENGRVIIGFVPEIPTEMQKFGLIGAFAQSFRRNYRISALTFKIIGRIFRGSASVRTLSGPIEIARMSGNAARTGSARVFFGFLGLVSLQLGVFNLLPIPILDGGVIALLLIEGLIRRDISLSIKEKIVQAGFVFLILLMGFVVFNDLSKIIDLNGLFR